MSLDDDDRLLAAVAAVLGETIALVRRRGFHIDSRSVGSELPLVSSRYRQATDYCDDALDLAMYGIDWDAGDDSRLNRRAGAGHPTTPSPGRIATIVANTTGRVLTGADVALGHAAGFSFH